MPPRSVPSTARGWKAALALLLLAAFAGAAAPHALPDVDGPPCVRALDAWLVRLTRARAAHVRACLDMPAGGARSRADCLADADPRTRRAERAAKRVARTCGPALDVARVIHAATALELASTYDLVGGQVDHTVVDDPPAATCQRTVLRRAQRCRHVRLRETGACLRRRTRDGDPGACLGADPKGRVAAACDRRLAAAARARCAGLDLRPLFPACAPHDVDALRACLAASMPCAVCQTRARAGGVALDCDGLDDGAANGSCLACLPEGPLPDGDVMSRDLATYAGFGPRRTGTPGADASAAWLAGELTRLGFDVAQRPFPYSRFLWDPAGSSLVVDGASYDAVPIWFPTTGTVTGPLRRGDDASPADLGGTIALVSIAERILTAGSPTHDTIQHAIARGAAGVVVVNGYRPEAVALNVYPPFDRAPWPVPVVLVGERHRAALEQALDRTATIAVAGAAGPATAVNVVARRIASPGAPTFVVSTPYTGWFTTAGERGPGIALFLGLARWVAERRPDANYLFVAIAGMELGTLGEHAFLDAPDAPPPDDVRAWLHLGAGIVTWGVERTGDGGYVRTRPEFGFVMSVPGPIMQAAACGLGSAGEFVAVPAALAGGSLEIVVARGYPAFGLQTTNDLYHTAEDVLGRNEPDAALLQPVASGLVRALVALGG